MDKQSYTFISFPPVGLHEVSDSHTFPLETVSQRAYEQSGENALEGYLLSPQQAQLWFLHQQQGNSPLPYLTQGIANITGALDVERLESAIQCVSTRYEILRTTFRCVAGMTTPVQTIATRAQVGLVYQDLSNLDAQEQQAALDFLARQQRGRDVELDQTPLRQLVLLKLATHRHALLLTLPALYADCAGLENLLQEISHTYADGNQQGEPGEDMMQYADLSEWQNELLQSEGAEQGRTYWLQRRSQRESSLPCEGKSAPGAFVPQSFLLPLDDKLIEKTRAYVQEYQNSLSSLLLSCWQVVLWRLCGQEPVVVGTRYEGRTYEGLKEALGLFARFLPIPFHLEEKQRFCDVVQQIEQSVLEDAEWQEYFSWEYLPGSESKAEQSHFFPFCYEFQEQAADSIADKICFSWETLSSCIDRFKVKLSIAQASHALLLDFGYDSRFFDRTDIERLAAEFCALLNSALSNPTEAIGALELVSGSEYAQLLAWNNTQTVSSGEACIHKLFADQVARTPGNVAVVSGDCSLTYRELDVRSNRLAHYLQALGVKAETPVGICLKRSPDVVVAIFGVLKAGGAYVPLDPSYPRERLAYMLADSHATVLLTQETLRDHLPSQEIHCICLDSDWPVIANEGLEDLPAAAGLDNLAYIMYTSGSTGQPKGVMIEHKSLTNYICWVNESLVDRSVHHLPMITRLSFDASLKQIFAPLLCGKTVQVLSEDVVTHPAELLQALSIQRKVALNCVPALWDTLLDIMQGFPAQSDPDSITDLFVGGEALKPDVVARSLQALPHLRISNLYGPTETTANASYQRITSPDDISIGLPIANTQIYLLDTFLHLVPIGAPGEIYIGGRGVARGYRENPALTADRFVPDPFGKEPGARLYRTGDLARRRPDGRVEYLGRLDTQVKIRGFRIEPGEIESVLCQHPAVRAAVVTTCEDDGGQCSLVAAIVIREDHSLPIQQIADYVKTQLPDYMLPSSFMILDSLPLMPNGKIDNRALALLAKAQRPGLKEDYVAPQTQIEQALADIWSKALAVERVGIYDDFFALGGNSLLTVRITSRIREVFQINLPLRTLLEANTVAELADIVSNTVA